MDRTTGEICCRLCFCSDGNFLNIFNDAPSVYDIAELLKKYFQDDVKPSDPLPNIICADCWHKTESFHEFHEKVLNERDQYLNSHSNEIMIKTEPEPLLVEGVTAGQFDDSDENMCVDPITVKPMDIDNEHNTQHNEQESFSILLPENDESIFDGNFIIKEESECEFELYTCTEGDSFEKDYNDESPNRSTNENLKIDLNPDHFKCDRCDEKLPTKVDLLYHIRTVHSSGSFFCDHCDKIFKTKRNVKDHLKYVHFGGKLKEKCGLCEKRFRTFKDLHRHLQSEHPDDLNNIREEFKNIPLLDLSDERMKAAMEKFVDQTCNICHTKLNTMAIAKNHYLTEHKNPNGYFQCCKPKLFAEKALIDHLNWHINPSIFRCRLCCKIFSARCSLEGHARCHESLNTEKYTCDKCSVIFARVENYKLHMKTYHNIIIPTSRDSEAEPADEENLDLRLFDMTCDMDGCTTVFTSLSNARQHYINDHVKRCGYIKCSDPNCRSFRLRTPSDVKGHIAWHKDPECFKCKTCGSCFKIKQQLSSHSLIHSKKYKCDKCDKKFSKKGDFMEHMQWHEDPTKTKLPCPHCNKIYNSVNSWRAHCHFAHPSAVEKFICEICAIGFKTPGLLKKHLKIIHKQGPQKPKQKFKCDICSKLYSSQGSLYTHKITHETGQFECTLCGHVSRNRVALSAHMNVVHVEAKFKCHLCDKSFKSPPALEDHIAIHSNNKRWKCEYCEDVSFIWRTDMYKHRKRAHPAEWEAEKAKKDAKRNEINEIVQQ